MQAVVKLVIIYHTTTNISLTEIAQVLVKGQMLLADMALTNGYHLQSGEKPTCVCLELELYLMLLAIQSWDPAANAINYFDQPSLIKLLSKVEQLFYICKFKPAC